MKKTTTFALAALIIGMMVSACATPPTEEMDKAIDAVTRAENDADAVAYAGGTLTRARGALDQMKVEADAKRYEAAKTYANEAVAAAEKAVTDGRAGAARAREEATRLLSAIKPEIADTETALNAAKQTPALDLDFDSLDGSMAAAKTAYGSAETSLNTGKYAEVAPAAQPIRPILNSIRGELSNAAASISRKK
jgi:HEPN domain-containing protein